MCGRSGYVSILRIVRHGTDQFLVFRDFGFGKMAFHLADQVRNFFLGQFSLAFQIPRQFLQNPARPLRSILSRCFGKAKQGIAQRCREENAGVQHCNKIAACGARQSELVVDAVCDGIPGHLFNSLMATLIAFLSERNQILQINAPMSSRPMEVNLSFVKQPNKKLA